MKCENCGSELAGAAIVCRQCNHNNAQGRVSQWRARRTGELKEPSASTRSISPLADTPKSDSQKLRTPGVKAIEPRKSAPLPFEPKIQINHASPSSTTSSKASSILSPPSSLSNPATSEDDPGVVQYPAWRTQLKERVQQSRDRKVAGTAAVATEPDEAELDPNPIVEAALKRIRWSAQTTPPNPLPRVARHGSQATALAEVPDFDDEPHVEPESPKPPVRHELKSESATDIKTDVKMDPKPVRTTPTPTNPLLARRPTTQPVNRPETKSLPARQTGIPTSAAFSANVYADASERPLPKPSIDRNEVRVQISPATIPEVNPAVETPAVKPRVTGEIKTPPALPQTSPQVSAKVQTETGATAATSRKPVETQVIGLSPTNAGTIFIKPLAATLWVRTLAGACDFEIVATAFLPLFASYATLNTSLGRESFAILFVLLAVLTFCYQMLTLTLADRTSGMACLNLQLINLAASDKPISMKQKFARAVAATAGFLCPPLNLIVMQSNQQRHSLPDLLSGTTLVEK